MSQLKDQILGAKDLEEELVSVPQWGVDVLVTSMTAGGRMRIFEECYDSETATFRIEKAYLSLVLQCVRDPESRELLFDENDRPRLAEKSGTVIDHLAQVAMRVSALTQDATNDVGNT